MTHAPDAPPAPGAASTSTPGAPHFRDVAQANRALALILRAAGASHLWTVRGPGAPLDAAHVPAGALFPFTFAWAAYEGALPERVTFADVSWEAAQAMLSLWTAMLDSPDAVDRWIAEHDAAPERSARAPW
jgi:hypothetical protein